jgi:pyruvate,water dikinase
MTPIVPLEDAAAEGQARAGGKAVRLSELIAAGFRVPRAFVVTTDAFAAHLEATGTTMLREGEYPTPELLGRIASHPLDAALANGVLAAFDALGEGAADPLVCAVRSSAADEDGTFASFAGQHATYYYTRRDEVLARIVDCWISAFSLEARAYRRELGLFAAPSMAVIVQVMVPAEISGVTFTRDPTGEHDDSLLIESCWGLGAALVDGRVSPDAYRVARRTRTLEARRIGIKRLKVAESLLDAKGSRLEPVPRHLQQVATLDDDAVAAVADLALGCEERFGVPQDVEWAMAGGRLYLLQSRPITKIATAPRAVTGRWIAFKPVLENSTAPFTPLSIDVMRRVLPAAMRFIDGRLYLDFDAVRRALPIVSDETALADALLLRKPPFRLDVSWQGLARTAGLLLAGYLTAGPLFARTRALPGAAFAGFAQRCESLLADESLDLPDMLTVIIAGRHAFAPIGDLVLHANVAAVRYFVLLGVLERLVEAFAPDLGAEHVAALTTGREDMLSREMVADLERLAAIASARPAIRSLLLADRFDSLPHQLAAHPEGGPFVEALAAFMARYGHRGTREIELSSARWREDPTPLFAMLRNLLRGHDGDARANRPDARRAQAHAALRREMPNPFARAIAERLASRIAYYAALRENTRHWHSLGFATLRSRVLAIEQQLLADGRLKCPDDVFYLHWDEVVELREGRIGWRHVEDRIRTRRRRHQLRARKSPPLSYNFALTGTAQGSVRLTGACASPGRATGRARLIEDPAADGRLEPGDVLVAPYTDPTWTPLFLHASAVVVETGSYLSHAGTIARELGIPCLVDVAGVIDAVRDGLTLDVDATAGSVLVVDTAGAPA